MAKPRLSYTGHTYGMNNGGWFGLTQQQNPFSKMNVGNTVGALGAVAGQLGHSLIGGGYDADGVGNGIANIGGSIGGAISTVNPLVGGIVSAASGIVGGLTNRAFGTKENKANINAIEQNTTNMNQVGNALAGVGDSDSFFKMAGSMGSSSGFNTGDLVKGGWFSKGKARRKAQKYLNAENSALAFQNHGMALGAQGVDSNQDDDVMAHFAAYGGEIGPMGRIGQMGNYDNMGAIEYGLAADYIAAKNRKNEIDDKMPGMVGLPALNTFSEGGGIHIKHPGRLTALKKRTGKTEAELWAEGRPEVRKMITFARNARKWKKAYGGYLDAVDNLLAFGGDLQTNGADYPTGLTHIEAGLSHELNPNEGVQMGTDSQGTPNLVEENEVVWQDYVFSNRIPIDEGTKAKFHIGKKKEMTYADLAKKLEKEITERPNDPISKAGFNAQMEQLEAEQERQKAEMEAERAREAFEAMSPEEQTALMQQVAQAQQQEAVAQEQAMQEQAMAEQGMVPEETVAPEEATMISQEEMPVDGEEGVPVEGEEMAEGGNLFADGGALEWLKKHYPDIAKTKHAKEIASALEKKAVGRINYPMAMGYLLNGDGNFLAPNGNNIYSGHDEQRAREHYRQLLDAGMSSELAFEIAFPKVDPNLGNIKHPNHDFRVYKKQSTARNALRKELVEDRIAMQGNIPEVTITAQKPASSVEKTKASSDSSKTGLKQNSETNGSGLFSNIRSKMNEAIANAYNQIASQEVPQVENNLPQAEQSVYNGEASASRRGNTGNRSRGYIPRAVAPSSSPVVNGTSSVVANPSAATTQQAVTPVVSAPAAPIVTNDGLVINPITGEPDFVDNVVVTPNGNVVASSEAGDFAADKAAGYPTADPSTYTASAIAGDAAGTTEEDQDIIMNHRSTWPRYAGLFGPAVGLGMMAAGVGRPDYSALDAAVRMGTGDIRLADYKPLGDYLTYRPMDIWAEQNRLDANARATDRAIRNSGLPTATKNASLLANAYNNQIASSELYKKALEYNDAKETQVKGFNRGTNQFNAEAYNKNSQFNANAMNRAKQYQANLALNAAAQKMNADAAWYNGIYGNLSGLFEGLGDLGRENYEYNQFVDYLGSGAVPGVTKKKLVDAGYAKWAKDGGKVQKKKNKKGLTF